MSFNPNDFLNNDNTLSENQLNQLNQIYVKKNGGDVIYGNLSINGGINLNSSITTNNKIISETELSYLEDTTSNLQQQINGLSNDITNDNNNFTGINTFSGVTSFNNDVNINNNLITNGKTISPTELGYLDGVSGPIQSQINNLSAGQSNLLSNNNVFTGQNSFNNQMNINGNIYTNLTTITPTELSYLDNIQSNIQNQLNAKQNNIVFNTNLTMNNLTTNSIVNNGKNINIELDNLELNKQNKIINSTNLSLNDINYNNGSTSLINSFNSKQNVINSNSIVNLNDVNFNNGSTSLINKLNTIDSQINTKQNILNNTSNISLNQLTTNSIINNGVNLDTKLSDLQTQITTIDTELDTKQNTINNSTNLITNQITTNNLISNNININTKLNELTLDISDLNTKKIDKPLTSIENNLCVFNNNNQIKDNNLSIITNLTNTSDNLIASSKAVKDYINSEISNLQSNNKIGQGLSYYFSNTSSGINNYEFMYPYPPNELQHIKSVTVQANELLINEYITQNFNRNLLPAGEIQFFSYSAVDDNTNYSYLKFQLYKRSSTGVETVILDDIRSNDINTIYPSHNVVIGMGTIIENVILNTTDELIIKVYGGTLVSNKAINVYWFHGGQSNSYFTLPIVYKHNDLVSLQGGNQNERYHLTLNEYNKATTYSSILSDGILSLTDYQKFNNKQDLLNTSSALTINIIKANQFMNSQNQNLETLIGLSLYNYVMYVSKQNGLDTNNGFDLKNAKQTITNALQQTSIMSQGINLFITPQIYSENLIITAQNLSISSINGNENSSLVTINGTLDINSPSSLRFYGMRFNQTINIIGNGNIFFYNCYFGSMTLNKNGTGYMRFQNCDASGGGVININNGNSQFENCNLINRIVASNTSLIMNNSTSLFIQTNNVPNIYINNSIVYSLDNINPSILIEATSSSYIQLLNSRFIKLNQSLNRIAMLPSVLYSISNCLYDKTNSILGNNLSITNYYGNLDCDFINEISRNNLSFLNGTTSNLQNQLNNKASLDSINTFTNQNYFDNINCNTLTIRDNINLSTTFEYITFNYPGQVINQIGKAELSYLKYVTSDIQSQLDNKASITNNNTYSGQQTFSNIINLNNSIVANSINISPIELSYLDGTTSNIQTQLNNKPNLNTQNNFINENTFSNTTYIAKNGNNHYFELASVSQNNVTFMDIHCNSNFNTDFDIRLNFNNDDNSNNSGRGNLTIECNRTQIPNLRLTNNLILNDNTNITNDNIKQLYNNRFTNYYGTVVINPTIGNFNRVVYSLSTLGISETNIPFTDYRKIRITGSSPTAYLNNQFFVYGGNPKRADNSPIEGNFTLNEVELFYGCGSTATTRLSVIITIFD